MTSGSVTLNGMDDGGLAIIFEFKTRHEGMFGFNPQQMQLGQIVQPPRPPRIGYNNVILSWNKPEALKVLLELLQRLEHHRTGRTSDAQQD
jgi:hypothetical protein